MGGDRGGRPSELGVMDVVTSVGTQTVMSAGPELSRVNIIVLVASKSKWLLVSQFAGASPLSPLSQCG